MFFDRFDVCEAYYLFLSEHHTGQSSALYARLSRMLRYFRPRSSLSVATLSENAREIYTALMERERATWDTLRDALTTPEA